MNDKPLTDLAETTATADTTKELLKKLFYYLDITEESDSGRPFRPNVISSCRAMDGAELNEILNQLKAQVSDD